MKVSLENEYTIIGDKLLLFHLALLCLPPTGVNKIARGEAYSRNPWEINAKLFAPCRGATNQTIVRPRWGRISRTLLTRGSLSSSPLAILLSPVGAEIHVMTFEKPPCKKVGFCMFSVLHPVSQCKKPFGVCSVRLPLAVKMRIKPSVDSVISPIS